MWHMPKPLAIDLFCGLGGWAEGLLAEGYDVVGYDIEAHDYGEGGYPGTLILADVTTLHGSQFKDAALIVASPPCQEYSYMAMPWSKAKAKQAAIEADTTGEARRKLTFLFDTCFRLQREAIEAAGNYIPMIVENVRGAQKWVGPSKFKYGSFHLWGDVPALMPSTTHVKAAGKNWNKWKDWDGTEENNPAGVRLWGDGIKVPGNNAARRWEDRNVKRLRDAVGTKPITSLFGANCQSSISRMCSSKSPMRKRAAAEIAKIPFPLSQHIARVFKPYKAICAG